MRLFRLFFLPLSAHDVEMRSDDEPSRECEQPTRLRMNDLGLSFSIADAS